VAGRHPARGGDDELDQPSQPGEGALLLRGGPERVGGDALHGRRVVPPHHEVGFPRRLPGARDRHHFEGVSQGARVSAPPRPHSQRRQGNAPLPLLLRSATFDSLRINFVE
jgi:hypothetical protein